MDGLNEATSRVDYGYRRRAFSSFADIPAGEWAAICEDAGVPKSKAEGNCRYAAAWVCCEVAGGDYTLAPALWEGKQETIRDLYRRFEKNDLPKLEGLLTRYSSELFE